MGLRFRHLLLKNLSCLRMYDLVVELACVPGAAEGFHEIDGADHLLAGELSFEPLIAEQGSLRGYDVKIVGDTADVPIVGDFQSAPRVIDGSGLGGKRLGKRAEVADAVLNLLEGS